MTETSAMGNDAGQSLHVWEADRDLRTRNIGAASGERHIGTFKGPGLYNLVGKNGRAKTTILRILQRLMSGSAATSNVISDGESEATLELTPFRVTFWRTPGGTVEESTRTGPPPHVETMPAAIQTLIDGDGIKDPEARARHRLTALLSYSPITTKDDDIEKISEAWARLSVSDSLASKWEQLLEKSSSTKKIKRPMQAIGKEDLLQYSMQGSGKPILEAHSFIVDALNSLGLSGERCLEQQERVLSEMDGVVKAIRSRAYAFAKSHADRIREPESWSESAIDERLSEEIDMENLVAALAAAESELEKAVMGNQKRLEEIGRREEMQQKFSCTKPSVDDSLVVDVRKRLEGLECKKEELVSAVARYSAEISHLQEIKERTRESVRLAWDNFKSFSSRLYSKLGETSLDSEAAEASDLVLALAKTAKGFDKASIGKAEAELASKNAMLKDISGQIADQRRLLQSETDRLNASVESARRWEEAQELLAAPVAGPDQSDIELARAAVAEANFDVEIGKCAAEYQAAVTARDVEFQVRVELEDLSKKYRAAAKDTWFFLGQIVTRELSIPWLQVDGLEIYLGYRRDTGALNNDKRLLEEAEKIAAEAERQAQAIQDSDVSVGRFLMRRIRDASVEVDWVNMDDGDRISVGELHEACVAVMMERIGSLGSAVHIPWHVIAAFDDEKLNDLDRRAVESGVVLLSERPSRKGDKEEIHLEQWAARQFEG